MDPWDIVRLARHPDRPRPPDFVARLVDDFVELRGDRVCADDAGLLAGVGRMGGTPVAVLAHRRASGDPGAAGLRKAARLVGLAERFGLGVVSFVDVTGVHLPAGDCANAAALWGAVGATLRTWLRARTPTVGVLCGEGVSGGALALCATDRLLVLEHAFLAPVAPESASAVLWKTPERAAEAARRSHLTAGDLLALGLATSVVAEPAGGAHVDPGAAVEAAGAAVVEALGALGREAPDTLTQARAARWSALASAVGEIA